MQWKALLAGKLVANFALARPRLYVNMQHLQTEASDPQPVARNIRSGDEPYPSSLHLDAVVFGTGQVVLDGHANFLTEPHPGVKVMVRLEGIVLDYFQAVTNRHNLAVRKGLLQARGLVEYAPALKALDIETATIRDVEIEYVHTPARAGVVQEVAATTAREAREASDAPGLLLRARELRVVNSTVGFLNRAADPPYRAFLAGVNLTVANFSTRAADGPTRATLTGAFMGSGETEAAATFRPDPQGPNLDLSVRLANTDMPSWPRATLIALSGVSGAQTKTPTQADFDACNRMAETQVGAGASGSASPRSGSSMPGGTTSPGSSASRSGSPTGSTAPAPGSSAGFPSMSGGTTSDQTLAGIDVAARDNPAFQQAYQDCMKGRGF